MLVGGDHFTDSRGIPVSIIDNRELLQRALLRLSIKKGSLPEEPELGSELYKLKGFHGANLERLAQSYTQEALLPMPEVSVSSVSISRERPELLRLLVNLAIAENTYRLEVDVI